MLSVSSLTSGKGFYYTNLAREDYYLEGGEPPGRWVGDTAQKLGLAGPVRKEHLASILQGFGPDGEKLVQNAGKETRQAGLDLTFSAPKSVSVLWALGGEDIRAKLEHAHSRAVEKALQYVDEEAGW